MRIVRGLLETLLELVAPSECAACDASSSNDLGLCPACAGSLVVADPRPLRILDVPVVAPLAYAGATAEAIRRLKYGDRPDLARPLTNLVVRALHTATPVLLDSTVAFVPVPLHPRRLAERGYNQSALVARRLARACRAHFCPMLLVRTRDTSKQATLGAAARAANVAGAFAVRAALARRGRRVILVDDVVTTGATVRDCLTALREAGEHPVAVVAVARAGSASP